MTTSRACPQCGAPLPGGAEDWLCPKCLLGQAVPQPTLHSSLPTPHSDPVLHYFGDYELLEEIARGGMGVVYKARQVSLNRIVAVKLLQFGPLAREDFKRRFRLEAEAAASLQHPNIVAIHEVGEHEGQPYFSMDYVAGADLGEKVRNAPLPARRAAALLQTVAEAVHYAHRCGVIHRDLKPSNVLLDAEGSPRVTDFGLAKLVATDVRWGTLAETAGKDGAGRKGKEERRVDVSPSSRPNGECSVAPARDRSLLMSAAPELTITGQVLGTPGFMSPEQAGGKRNLVGPLCDVYSLGAVLYFLVTGRAPFAANSLEETLRQVHDTEPVSPCLLNPAIPRDLETICLKCLSKEASRRYDSAQSLAEDLGRYLRDEPIHAHPAGAAEKLMRWCRRNVALASALAAMILVGALGLAGILWQWRRAEVNARVAQHHATLEAGERLRAQEAVTQLELQRAEDLLEKDETVRGVAHLASIVRQQPDNYVAATRLISILTQRDFVMPVGAPLQHGRRVTCTEFSPDGRWVATASIDRTARLWDARTGQPLGEPLRHSNFVHSVHFSPDGQRLLTVSESPVVLQWDIATGEPIGQPLRHPTRVHGAQFSPDGRRIVTASDDQTAQQWDAQTGERLLAPLRHPGPARNPRFSPDGRRIVTISGNAAYLWDSKSGQPVGAPLFHGTNLNIDGVNLNSAQFSPDSQWVVTASELGFARVWDTATGMPTPHYLRHKEAVVWAEFSPDGNRIVTASRDGSARVWNGRTGEPLTEPLVHGGQMHNARFSPDGQRLLFVLPDNAGQLRDVHSDRLLAAPFQHDGFVDSASFSPDGQFVVIASSTTARIWDIRPSRAFHLRLPHHQPVRGAHFSPDGERLSTASDYGRVWDAHTGRPSTPPRPHPGGGGPASFSPDGQRILTAGWDGKARLWDARTGRPLCDWLTHENKVNHAEFSPDGNWFLTLSGANSIRLWDGHTGEFQSEVVRYDQISGDPHFSPDSQTVAFGLFDNNAVRLVDVRTGKIRVEMHGHRQHVMDTGFSPDGRRIATAAQDTTARVWDTATGAPLTPPLSHKSTVICVAFSPNGSNVVTASADATARIWDANSGRALTEPLRHRKEVSDASFSPDGRWVLTASADGTARLWDTITGQPLTDPFRHADLIWRAVFSPDGQWVATASRDRAAGLWELPPMFDNLRRRRSEETHSQFETRHPEPGTGERYDAPASTNQLNKSATVLLADLAEAVVGQRLSEGGTLESVSSVRLLELRQRIAATAWGTSLPPTSFNAAQTNTRKMPALPAPSTNAFSRWLEWFLADRSTRTISPNSPVTVPEYVSRLMEDKTVVSAREALLIMPTNAVALAHLADMLLISSNRNSPVTLSEAEFLHRRAEGLAGFDLPARDPKASPNLIDLGAFYNGGKNEEFPGRVLRLAGTDFDVRGWINLEVRPAVPRSGVSPDRIEEIRIEKLCRRLHFLHTALYLSRGERGTNGEVVEQFDVPLGTVVGRYLIQYVDGEQLEIPILHGPNVRDYWNFAESEPDDPALVVAWTGSNQKSRQWRAATRLYKQTWENPRPEVAIHRLDFIHGKTRAVPVLVALTAEP